MGESRRDRDDDGWPDDGLDGRDLFWMTVLLWVIVPALGFVAAIGAHHAR